MTDAERAAAGSTGMRRTWRRDLLIGLLIGLLSFAVYNINLRTISAGDAYPARYLPFNIIHSGAITLEQIAPNVAQGFKIPATTGKSTNAYWMARGKYGQLVSLYPIVTPIVIAPLYVPAVLYLNSVGWDFQRLEYTARIMEKFCASLMASVSVMLLYLTLRRQVAQQTAAFLALVYAFGTATWVISSQALWMHGLAQLLVTLALFLLTGSSTALRAFGVGLICGLIACNRQMDAILAAGLGLYSLYWAGRRRWLALLLGGAIPVALTIFYNLEVIGSLVGTYGLFTKGRTLQLSFESMSLAIAGLLVSPVHGLLFLAPFLLFVPFFFFRALRDARWKYLNSLLGVTVLAQLVAYGAIQWVPGISWGYRFLVDMLPILFWILAAIYESLSKPARVVFAVTAAIATVFQALGAFGYTGAAYSAAIVDEMSRSSSNRAIAQGRLAWNIRYAPFLADMHFTNDLGMEVLGTIDVAAENDKGEIEIAGWTLVGGRTPYDLHLIVDGDLRIGSTGTFFERADVVQTMGNKHASGWRITFPADRLKPGTHVVAALVRGSPDSEPRVLPGKTFISHDKSSARDTRDWSLPHAARYATQRLAQAQSNDGYWLTHFTKSTRYEGDGKELNVFTNAEIIDVLTPVEKRLGVEGMLANARGFLNAQIEDNGLVRYHGKPNPQTEGSLGCRITPDADDTALAWRISPKQSPQLLRQTLSTLQRYRAADGLYRTWLAPRERYECIDPGSDPNPPDVGIQVHIFLLLAKVAPPQASRLCKAIQARAGDDRLWVYYAMSPAMVVMRLPELERLSCPVLLPPARLQARVDGQAVWMELLERLRQIEQAGPGLRSRDENRAFLAALGRDTFAALRAQPILVYHNDLTATVRRFYWSPDLSYALWLRLYAENEQEDLKEARHATNQ